MVDLWKVEFTEAVSELPRCWYTADEELVEVLAEARKYAALVRLTPVPAMVTL